MPIQVKIYLHENEIGQTTIHDLDAVELPCDLTQLVQQVDQEFGEPNWTSFEVVT